MVEPATPIEPTAPATDGTGGATTGPPAAPAPRRRPGRALVAIAILVVVMAGGLVVWQAGRSGPAPASSPASASASSSASAPSAPGSADAPLIAIVDASGGLATVDSAGRTSVIATEPGSPFGFPAWSPDGSRVASIRSGTPDTTIEVFDIRGPGAAGDAASAAPAGAPVVVYRSAAVPPFYLYWAPDGRHVSFLATEADGLSLRIAPADGSAPLDGSGPGAIIRRGAPLYFDWIATDRLLLHVGAGPEAFLGEVGLDGSAVGPGVAGAGDFRPGVVGSDGRFMAFVRGAAPSADLVVAARDGTSEHRLPVFGPTAAVFDPAGATVASIAADVPTEGAFAFPAGPLRLMDAASGAVRTLLDGSVISFFWSPDGRTIAVLRLQAGGGAPVAVRPIVAAAAFTPGAVTAAASPSPATSSEPDASAPAASVGPAASASPTAQPGPELHLLFVNVADGAIRSDRVVRPTGHFVNQFLPYFDQYALSHRVWSPDSRSVLLPLVDARGRDQLFILPADGSDGPPTLDGRSGFWSP
jgi:TolB protein